MIDNTIKINAPLIICMYVPLSWVRRHAQLDDRIPVGKYAGVQAKIVYGPCVNHAEKAVNHVLWLTGLLGRWLTEPCLILNC